MKLGLDWDNPNERTRDGVPHANAALGTFNSLDVRQRPDGRSFQSQPVTLVANQALSSREQESKPRPPAVEKVPCPRRESYAGPVPFPAGSSNRRLLGSASVRAGSLRPHQFRPSAFRRSDRLPVLESNR